MSTPLLQSRRSRLLFWPSWAGDDGIRNLVAVAVPLILSNAVHSLNMFTDRTLLAQYDEEAFAAALQGGMLNWTLMSFFFAAVAYSGTFVAQYFGAKKHDRIGPSMWHGIYLAVIGGAIMAATAPFGYRLFELAGHEGNIPKMEGDYYRVLSMGAVVPLVNAALSGFFSGQGRTRLTLLVNCFICGLNVFLDLFMIFRPVWIFPAGIAGAAWATLIASACGTVAYLALILLEKGNEAKFRVRSGFAFDGRLMARMLRFGLPTGVNHTLDMIGFTTFMIVVGVFGMAAQHASNMAMNLNMLLFIPAIGLHSAVTILAGQFCGADERGKVERMTANACWIMNAYMAAVLVIYLGVPEYVLAWFRGSMGTAKWEETLALAKVLLVFVAIYTVFDGMLLTYNGALKGAGDNKFAMWAAIIFSQLLLTGPSLAVWAYHDRFESPEQGVMVLWTFCTVYIAFLGFLNLGRFWMGEWRNIKMIEHHDDPDEDEDEGEPAVERTAPEGAMAC